MNKNEIESIIITGGNGMLGSQADFGVRLNRKKLNILSPSSIQKAIDKYKPRIILHCAALTDITFCEEHPDLAYELNVVGTYNVAKICREKKIKLIYISTCAVFDGAKKNPYRETDRPNPINIYGRTKWLGELIVRDLVSDSLIVRTSWLFGGGFNIDKKFVISRFNELKRNQNIKGTIDRYGSPTYVPDLLFNLAVLIKNKTIGIIHLVNEGNVSYYDVAKSIKDLGNFKSKVEQVKARNIEMVVKRGAMEALVSDKIKMRPWQNALSEYIQILKNGKDGC